LPKFQKERKEVCKNILDNTAVFKKDETGVKGFTAFMNACGLEVK